MEREFLKDGGFTDKPILLEMPASIIHAPDKIENWEDWTDTATASGRARYNQAKEELDQDSHFRIVGTPLERAEQAAFEHRVYYNSPRYQDETTREFLEVLALSPAPW
jgi:hypothetical protein